jgi:hypothetical protein
MKSHHLTFKVWAGKTFGNGRIDRNMKLQLPQAARKALKETLRKSLKLEVSGSYMSDLPSSSGKRVTGACGVASLFPNVSNYQQL